MKSIEKEIGGLAMETLLQEKEKKKGIVTQIQNRIGLSVNYVLTVIAILSILIMRFFVMKANDTELKMDSEEVALQMELFFATYEEAGSKKGSRSMSNEGFAISDTMIEVSGMDISLIDITEIMERYKIGNNGYVMLLSQAGNFIYHPRKELVNTSIESLDISQNVVQAVREHESQLLKYKVEGETKYGYITPVGESGLLAISCIPLKQYYSSLFISLLMLASVFLAGFVYIIIMIRNTAGKIVKPLEELKETAMQLANGNLEVSLNVTSEDEVGDLARSMEQTVKRLKEYINYIDEISEVLSQMADGKLSVQLKYVYAGEFKKVKDALIHISQTMSVVMKNIAETSDQVSLGSEELAKAAQGLAEGAEMQSAAIEELVATTTMVAKRVEENRNDSEASALHTKDVTVMMEESQLQMEEMKTAMDKIGEASNKVVSIIKTIEDIASQTNLLSLNASIEAARAGESGRGFAVVAGEIGNLANESAKAVNTTRELISISLKEIEKGNILAKQVGVSLKQAVSKVEEVNEMTQRTAQNAKVQMENVNQIRNGVEEIAHIIQDNSAMAEESSATSEELAAQAVALNELIKMFEFE